MWKIMSFRAVVAEPTRSDYTRVKDALAGLIDKIKEVKVSLGQRFNSSDMTALGRRVERYFIKNLLENPNKYDDRPLKGAYQIYDYIVRPRQANVISLAMKKVIQATMRCYRDENDLWSDVPGLIAACREVCELEDKTITIYNGSNGSKDYNVTPYAKMLCVWLLGWHQAQLGEMIGDIDSLQALHKGDSDRVSTSPVDPEISRVSTPDPLNESLVGLGEHSERVIQLIACLENFVTHYGKARNFAMRRLSINVVRGGCWQSQDLSTLDTRESLYVTGDKETWSSFKTFSDRCEITGKTPQESRETVEFGTVLSAYRKKIFEQYYAVLNVPVSFKAGQQFEPPRVYALLKERGFKDVPRDEDIALFVNGQRLKAELGFQGVDITNFPFEEAKVGLGEALQKHLECIATLEATLEQPFKAELDIILCAIPCLVLRQSGTNHRLIVYSDGMARPINTVGIKAKPLTGPVYNEITKECKQQLWAEVEVSEACYTSIFSELTPSEPWKIQDGFAIRPGEIDGFERADSIRPPRGKTLRTKSPQPLEQRQRASVGAPSSVPRRPKEHNMTLEITCPGDLEKTLLLRQLIIIQKSMQETKGFRKAKRGRYWVNKISLQIHEKTLRDSPDWRAKRVNAQPLVQRALFGVFMQSAIVQTLVPKGLIPDLKSGSISLDDFEKACEDNYDTESAVYLRPLKENLLRAQGNPELLRVIDEAGISCFACAIQDYFYVIFKDPISLETMGEASFDDYKYIIPIISFDESGAEIEKLTGLLAELPAVQKEVVAMFKPTGSYFVSHSDV